MENKNYIIGYDPIVNNKEQIGKAAFVVCRMSENKEVYFEHVGTLHASGNQLEKQLDEQIEEISKHYGNCYIMKETK